MSSFEKDTKKLIGKVKIGDVQAEIDRLVAGINEAIDVINEVNNSATTIDPTRGSTTISSSDYTLTCGGFKKILSTYSGKFLVKPIAVNMLDNIITFPALFVHDSYIEHINSAITSNGSALTELKFDDDGTERHAAYLDWMRGETILNTTPDNIFFNPDNIPVVKLRDNAFPVKDKINIPDDRAFFLCPMAAKNGARSNSTTKLANTIIYRRYINTGDVGKHSQTLYSHNPIFIPNGAQNKITFENSNSGASIHKSVDFTVE